MLDRSHHQIMACAFEHDDDISVPSSDNVREALQRIIASTEFRSSPHLAAFLRYSVETSLAGEGASIKAYSIATGVLGRPPTFDPQADPIVRVEATRLRRAMERYYLHEGANDPILIDIPRGRYVAYFSFRTSASQLDVAPASVNIENYDRATLNRTINARKAGTIFNAAQRGWNTLSVGERRSVAVLACALVGGMITWGVVPTALQNKPVTEQALILQTVPTPSTSENAQLVTGSAQRTESTQNRMIFAMLQLTPFTFNAEQSDIGDIAHRFTDQIASHARDFEGIPVISPDVAPVDTPSSSHLYVLAGTLFQRDNQHNKIDVSVRLTHQTTREIVWTSNYSLDRTDASVDDQIKDMTSTIVSSLAGLYGAIRVDDAGRHHDPEVASTSCQICLADSDIALRTENPEQINQAMTCLTALSIKKPDEALIYKQLAALRLALKGSAETRIENMSLAVKDLETAIRLQPEDQFAKRALTHLQNASLSAQ
jgi:TolB-like protein